MADRYDVIRYPGHAFAQTHPDRVAALATLFGIDPVAPAGCRMLEIGCGDGGNLLGMALALPDASFVGFDLSGRAIELARARADELGLANVRFEEIGIEDFDAPAASFDYVVAHGVFSWVPDPVRERLLALCGNVLSERGVAFVSYNALPGYRHRQTLRELLALELEGVDEPRRRIAGARARARAPQRRERARDGDRHRGRGAARPLGRAAVPRRARRGQRRVPHHGVHSPSRGHGLRYLAEADLRDLRTDVLPPDVRDALPGTDDIVRREQVLDYLRLRRFRQTLLSATGWSSIARRSRPGSRRWRSVRPPARIVADDERPGLVTFEAPGGARVTSDDERVVAALVRWVRRGRRRCASRTCSATRTDAQAALCDALLDGALRGVIWLHAHPPAVSAHAGERPHASALARLQARDREPVMTLRHASIRVDDELDRRVLALLDGTRDRAALRARLAGVRRPRGRCARRARRARSSSGSPHAALLVA